MTESELPFEGLRGIVSLSNVPCIRACLKYGCSLIDIEDVDSWVWQFPPKAARPTEKEVALCTAAETIIRESLNSFRAEKQEPGDIPSTAMAVGAVSKHYYGAGLGPSKKDDFTAAAKAP